jgi:hypothetical protein
VGHEEFVRNQVDPSKGKGRVLVRVKFVEKLSETDQNELLSLRVEALEEVNGSEQIHEQTIVRFLVKFAFADSAVLFEHLRDGFEQLDHEFVLVEVLESLHEDNDQLDHASDVSVVQSVSRSLLS